MCFPQCLDPNYKSQFINTHTHTQARLCTCTYTEPLTSTKDVLFTYCLLLAGLLTLATGTPTVWSHLCLELEGGMDPAAEVKTWTGVQSQSNVLVSKWLQISRNLPKTVYNQSIHTQRQATHVHTYSRMTYGSRHMDAVIIKPHRFKAGY